MAVSNTPFKDIPYSRDWLYLSQNSRSETQKIRHPFQNRHPNVLRAHSGKLTHSHGKSTHFDGFLPGINEEISSRLCWFTGRSFLFWRWMHLRLFFLGKMILKAIATAMTWKTHPRNGKFLRRPTSWIDPPTRMPVTNKALVQDSGA